MSATSHNPTAYPRFVTGKELRSDEWRETQAVQAALFAGAYRIASSLSGVETEGYKDERTTSQYHALLKVVLACAARERLAALLGEEVAGLPVVDPQLALMIRAFLRGDERRGLRLGLQVAGADGRLDEFWDGGGAGADDVVALALAVRDGIVSGGLNSLSAHLGTKKRAALMLDLAGTVLRDSDERFTAWVESGMGEPLRRD